MTYAYYRDVYRGADVPEAAFATWALRAEERLSADTCGRSDGALLAALAAEQASAACAQSDMQAAQDAADGRTQAQDENAAAGDKALQETAADVSVRSVATDVPLPGAQARRAVCALADILYHTREDERARGPLVSETVGGWSRSYAARDTRDTMRRIRAVEALYLGGTGLLYRGR